MFVGSERNTNEMTIDTHTHGPIEIAKVIKRHKDIAVVKLKEPIYGGIYAVHLLTNLQRGYA
mgnify:CR=1 FL=1